MFKECEKHLYNGKIFSVALKISGKLLVDI